MAQSRLIPGEMPEDILIAKQTGSASPLCQAAIPPLAEQSANRQNTLFIHPGLLLLGINWDQSLAVDAGMILTKQHFAGKMIEIRDRDPSPIYAHARHDPGTEFIGIHYSMGGRPEIISASLEALKQAARERATALRYHAILFDPFAISEIGQQIDIDDPALGYIFILLSSEYSFLRPGVEKIPKSFSESSKLIFIHAEDFGENWDHFGMLKAFTEAPGSPSEALGKRKMQALLQAIFAIALNDDAGTRSRNTLNCLNVPTPQAPQPIHSVAADKP